VKAAQLEKKQIKEQSKALETQLKSQIQSLEEKLLLSEQLMYDAQRQVEELQQKIKTSTEHFKDSLDTLNLEKNLEKKAIQEQSEALENKLQSQIRPLTEKVLQSEKEMHDNQRQIEALEHQNTILTKQCADLATTLKKDNDIIFSTIDAKSLSSVLNCYATSGLFQKTISLTFTNLRNLTRGKLKKLTIHDIEKNIQGENQEKLLEIFRHPWIKNDILASHHMTKTANALRDIAYLFRNPSLSASPSTKSR
jgi:polyhydroxyalkanoate synthesis regulator phasin